MSGPALDAPEPTRGPVGRDAPAHRPRRPHRARRHDCRRRVCLLPTHLRGRRGPSSSIELAARTCRPAGCAGRGCHRGRPDRRARPSGETQRRRSRTPAHPGVDDRLELSPPGRRRAGRARAAGGVPWRLHPCRSGAVAAIAPMGPAAVRALLPALMEASSSRRRGQAMTDAAARAGSRLRPRATAPGGELDRCATAMRRLTHGLPGRARSLFGAGEQARLERLEAENGNLRDTLQRLMQRAANTRRRGWSVPCGGSGSPTATRRAATGARALALGGDPSASGRARGARPRT